MKTKESIPEQDRFTLSFKDNNLEKEFRKSYDSSVRLPLRYGIIISLLSWLSSLLLIYFIIPESFTHLSVTTLLMIVPFFSIIVFATYSDKFRGAYHAIGACSNAWAGLYAIYFCHQFPNGVNFILPVIIFIVFFGSYMIRLRWIAGFLAAMTYVLGYHIYMVKYTNLEGGQLIFFAFVGWMTLIFAILAGRVAEQKNRLGFIQRKTIREQKAIIEKEKEASEQLLRNMLPPFIAQRLKKDKGVIADNHNDASVLFADIVGFTALTSKLSATDLVDNLNQIFSQFDRLTEQHELEKIKTIGDGYMVAGGLTKNKVDHLNRMANFSLELINYLETDEAIKGLNLKVRIGINSGAVVAGVIGINKFTYDLWGDTVNLASRLESHGEAGKICVSEVVMLRLENNFIFEKRARIDIKGRGEMQTYFLTGKKA